MESKPNSSNKNHGEVTFIDRRKSKSLNLDFYHSILYYFISKNYKDDTILFKLLYDKIYRPDLYKFIIKAGEKNLILSRNILQANEHKYEFKYLKKNDELEFQEDEFYSENNFLQKRHNIFILRKLTLYMTIPVGLSSVFFKLVSRSDSKFRLCTLLSLVIIITNLHFVNKENNLNTGEFYQTLEEANKKQILIYKKFYYD
jgi:hypothetical protein